MADTFKYLDGYYTIEEILKKNDNKFSRGTLVRRLNKGQNADDAVSAILKIKELRQPLHINGQMISRIKFAEENGIASSMLSLAPYKDMDPLVAVEKIKAKQCTKYPYETETGEIIYLTMMEAAKKFKINYTTIRKYILDGLTMNRVVETARANQKEILSVPSLTDDELNNSGMQSLTSIKERLRKYCIARRMSHRFIYYLVKEKGYSIANAMTRYNHSDRNGPNKWNYVVNDILLNSFCIKYMLDDKQFIDYLKKSDNNFILALEKSVFLNVFYTDFDLSPNNRADLLAIYQEMMTIESSIRMDFFKRAIRLKDKNGKSLIDRIYKYLLNKYGFTTLLDYYYAIDMDAEIFADNILEYIEQTVISFFEEKYNKISFIKRDLELLRIRAMYLNLENKEQVLSDNNISEREYDYMFGEASDIPNPLGERLYEGYKLIENSSSNVEVQLNEDPHMKLTYLNRWYY